MLLPSTEPVPHAVQKQMDIYHIQRKDYEIDICYKIRKYMYMLCMYISEFILKHGPNWFNND